MSEDREERVRERAHEIWQREGRPHGHDQKHWEQASAEIDAEAQSTPADASAGGGASSAVPELTGEASGAVQPKVKAPKTVARAKTSTTKRTKQ